MLWWSGACALHGLAMNFGFLLGARCLLGMGEGGAFPAATRVVAEWVPPHQRSTAMGIINAGTAVGSVLAPPLIGIILLTAGWRMVFFAAGAVGFAWVIWWSISYRGNNDASIATLDARLVAKQLSFADVLGMRRVQVLVFAKFMSDSAWYFYLFWLPKYLYDVRGFDVKHVSYYAWIPYAASGVGSFLGGWLSSDLLKRGRSLDFSRKFVLGLSAVFMPVVMLVPHVPVALGARAVQHCIFLPAVLVRLDYDFACGHLSAVRGGIGIGPDRIWRRHRRRDLWRRCGLPAGSRIWIWNFVFYCWNLSSHWVSGHPAARRQDTPTEDSGFTTYIESQL